VEKFYLLKIKSSSLRVMVPFHNVSAVGLRRVIRNGDVQKIVEFLVDGKVDHCGTDLFNLVRADGKWLIASVADTGRKECGAK